MNDTVNTTPMGEAVISDVQHFYIDAEGNRVEIPFDLSDGEASPEETTVYVAADGEDHPTIH